MVTRFPDSVSVGVSNSCPRCYDSMFTNALANHPKAILVCHKEDRVASKLCCRNGPGNNGYGGVATPLHCSRQILIYRKNRNRPGSVQLGPLALVIVCQWNNAPALERRPCQH